jgi:O-methyltransferase/demethyldecarbamoylnovobiocin O-methyltransferase/8-demethyl-8-(2,3-dimethoxy-alpha-L-rhamnosyl)tetracenomycin-C 4'-O-methyltransferase
MNTDDLEKLSQVAYSFKETIEHSYNSVVSCLNDQVEGDFVECGVAMGSQIGAFQCALRDYNSTNRIIWGFDSFEGIPLAGEFDTEQAGIGEITHDKFAPLEQRLITSGITSHSMESVIQSFDNWNLPKHNLRLIKGWFQHTLEPTSKDIEKIAVLRLDGDLHESTLVCLEYLYPKVSKGGIVIIDDWGSLVGCRVAVEQYFNSIKKKMPTMIRVNESNQDNGVVFFIKS